MKNKSNSKITVKIFKIISIALSLCCAVCFFLCFLLFFDGDIGYFEKSPFVTVSNLLLLISAAFSVICPFFISKDVKTADDDRKNRKLTVSAVAAVLYMIYVLFEIYVIIMNGFSVIRLLLTVFAFFSFLYHYVIFTGTKIGETSFVLLGISQIAWCTLTIAYSYFDYTVELNSPAKLLLQFACVIIMLFTTGEMRLVLGKPRPRMYLAFSSCALSVLLSAGAGSLAAALHPEYMTTNGLRIYENIIYSLIFIAMYIYILTRLIHFDSASEKISAPDFRASSDDTTENNRV